MTAPRVADAIETRAGAMVHKLLTKLRLTPGAPVMKCLKCHREGTVESVDGDTLAIPDAKIIAGGLAGSSGGYCFHALINFCSCTRCEDPAMSPPPRTYTLSRTTGPFRGPYRADHLNTI